MTQFVVEESCLFTAVASSLRNSIYSNSFSLQKCLRLRVNFEVQVRIDLSLLSLEPQISKANNTNCHLKFKFTDYFNQFEKSLLSKAYHGV